MFTTDYGVVSVSFIGDYKNSHYNVVAVPDFGLSASYTYILLTLNSMSFNEFVDYCDIKNELQSHSFIYINFCELACPKYKTELTIEDMADALSQVINQLKIGNFIGMGIGLGSEILLEYSLKHRDQLVCLVLSNVHRNVCSMFESFKYMMMKIYYKLGNMSSFYESLLYYHYTKQFLTFNSNLHIKYSNEVCSNNIDSIYMQLNAYYNRKYSDPKNYKFKDPLPMLLFYGRHNSYNQPKDILTFAQPLDKTVTSVIQINQSTHNVFQENPIDCYNPLIYFYQGLNIQTK